MFFFVLVKVRRNIIPNQQEDFVIDTGTSEETLAASKSFDFFSPVTESEKESFCLLPVFVERKTL